MRARLKEAARAAILEAAEQVFAEAGLHGARMEDIATRAGVSVGTLYNYFADRQALRTELREAHHDELSERLDLVEAEQTQGPFRARLAAFLSAILEHFSTHWKLTVLLVAEEIESGNGAAVDSRRHSMMRQLRLRVEHWVKVGVAEGALRPEDAALYPDLLVGMLRGVFAQAFFEKGAPPMTDVAPLVRFFFEGAGKGRK